jgi:hypothetical protein
MMGEGSMLVWWILVPLFAVVALYLIWYSRRRKRMLEAFAVNRNLSVRPELEKDLQETLDKCFSLEGDGIVRSFGRVSSVVDGGSIRLFRTVELLDLNPHGTSQSTHFTRTAALFDVSPDYTECFVLDTAGTANCLLPGAEAVAPDLADACRRIAASCGARHDLFVSMERGKGLLYLSPLVTGGESMDDLGSLYCMSERMRDLFGAPA